MLATLAACGPSVMVERPADPELDRAITRKWSAEIQRAARPGDWLVVRAYAAVSDVIVLATLGEEFSHAAMIDPERGTVIEALTPKVVEVPLADFVQRNRYVAVIRPTGMNAAEQGKALARARARIGAPYDYAGLFGSNQPGSFYCSELVYWASGVEARFQTDQPVVAPADLLQYGAVIYFSGRRDDPQILRAARGWKESAEKKSAGKSAEKKSAEKKSAEKKSAEKESAEKKSAEKESAEKESAEKESAEGR